MSFQASSRADTLHVSAVLVLKAAVVLVDAAPFLLVSPSNSSFHRAG